MARKLFDGNNLEDPEGENRRQIVKRQKREAGNRSAKVARALMELLPPAFRKIELSAEVREAAARARDTTSQSARRREERRLAGVLRKFDLGDVEAQLQEQAKSGRADARLFQLAEDWRARLIAEGQPAIDELHAELVGLDMAHSQKLVEDAQKERDFATPKGAAKALFRYVMTALRAQEE